jgi:hypothetical protein
MAHAGIGTRNLHDHAVEQNCDQDHTRTILPGVSISWQIAVWITWRFARACWSCDGTKQ